MSQNINGKMITKNTDNVLQKDKGLLKEIENGRILRGSFRTLYKWVYSAIRLTVGTTEGEIVEEPVLFLFKKRSVSDVMEAYALLYRLKWVKYSEGIPVYQLEMGKDMINGMYMPIGDYQKRRFKNIDNFMKDLDSVSSAMRDKILSEDGILYSELPDSMQLSIRSAMGVLIEEGNALGRKPGIDINDMAGVTLKIQDKTALGNPVKELVFGIDSKKGGYSFRWNNYDKNKNDIMRERKVSIVFDSYEKKIFDKKKMIDSSKMLNSTYVDFGSKYLSFRDIIIFLNESCNIDIVMHDLKKYEKRLFSSKKIVIWQFLDRICAEYGGWEWDLSEGGFLIFREPESPRKRLKSNT